MGPDSTSIDRIATEAAEWFTALRTGELTPEERQRFTAWLEASPQHVQEYLGVAETWGALSLAAGSTKASAEELVRAARSSSNVVVLGAVLHPQPEPGQAPRRRVKPFGIAAILFVGLLAAALTGAVLFGRLQGGQYTTARGEQRTVVLEDGSVVQLNAMSAMAVDFNDKERRIRLSDGEAFFRVAHDAARPFYVITPVATVRAVGTEFNVYSRGEKLAVSVVEGRVKVAAAALGGAVESTGSGPDASGSAAVAMSLGAGESAEMQARGPLVRSSHATADATAWMQRRLVFDNERLDDVIAEFNRYTPRQMQVTNPGLSSLRISGTFEADEPETLVAYLEQVQNVKATRRGLVTYFTPGDDPGQTP